MSEQDFMERTPIPGQITEPASSDAAIAKRVESIRQDIEGTNGKVVELPIQDCFTPKVIPIKTRISDDSPSTPTTKRLTAKDAALALQIFQERLDKQAA